MIGTLIIGMVLGIFLVVVVFSLYIWWHDKKEEKYIKDREKYLP
jgi:hypothetical protein